MQRTKDPQKALGAALRELRGERTQREIAKKAQLSVARYSEVEGGDANPTWATMRRIAEALNADIAEVAARSETQSSP